ncbi:hypothetical protein MMC22_008964 [Lobaria immixta]|nr:hypothetical protein [Lobaria immixta]
MLKSTSIILPSYGNLLCPHTWPLGSVSLSPSYPNRCQLVQPGSCFRVPRPQVDQCRNYFKVQSKKPAAERFDDLGWPKPLSATAIPTPYDIFQLEKSAPYSKIRFYELVKLYHPDRCSHEHNPSKCLSTGVRTERYRLVVAANCILSDPTKRKAYDRFGSGWDAQLDNGIFKQKSSRHNRDGRSRSSPENSPMNNATWEDWEKWYGKEAQGKQEPVYFSNEAFLSLVIIVVVLGGIAQATRVQGYSPFLEHIKMVHSDCSVNVRNRKNESHGFENNEDRMERFLRTRDPYGYGMHGFSEETDRRLLSSPVPGMDDDTQD